jgi:hypothetical protein
MEDENSDVKLASVQVQTSRVTCHSDLEIIELPHAITISCQIRFSLLCLHPGCPPSMICETALGNIF